MVTVEETTRALKALLLLMRFDARGAAGFTGDIAACRRSFWAYILALPAFLLNQSILIAFAPHAWDQPGVALLVQLIGYIAAAAAFPLLLLPVTAFLGRSDEWPGFITGYNWLSLINTIVVSVILTLAIGPLHGFGNVLNDVWLIYAIVVEAFLASVLLRVGPIPAIGIVLIDILVTETFMSVANWLCGMA